MVGQLPILKSQKGPVIIWWTDYISLKSDSLKCLQIERLMRSEERDQLQWVENGRGGMECPLGLGSLIGRLQIEPPGPVLLCIGQGEHQLSSLQIPVVTLSLRPASLILETSYLFLCFYCWLNFGSEYSSVYKIIFQMRKFLWQPICWTCKISWLVKIW